MERKKSSIIFLLIFIPVLLFGSEKEKIYKAYINDNMKAWKEIIAQMQQQQTPNREQLAELVNYQYGYIGYCLGVDKKKEAKHYLSLAEENLEELEAMNYSASSIHAYKAAFYGYKIGLAVYKAPLLGPKSVNHAELAIAADSLNPMGYIQYGNALFYMPAVLGGSKSEAIENFKKAKTLMERNPKKINNDWNYLSLLAIIGQSYEELGEFEQAKAFYQLALKKEPGFNWVKNELLPQIEKQENNGK